MHALLLSMLVAAQSPGAAGGIEVKGLAGTLFVLELEPRNLQGSELSVAKTLGDLLAIQLSNKMPDRKIITSGEVKELVDLESDRALADCSNAGCLAEIAGALDAEFVLFGSVTSVPIGDKAQAILTLSLADRKGTILRRESHKASSMNALLDEYTLPLGPLVQLLEGAEEEVVMELDKAKGEKESFPVLGLSVFGVSTTVAVVSGLTMWGAMNIIGSPQEPTVYRRQWQLALWGTTVLTGVAVAGMGTGAYLVMGE